MPFNRTQSLSNPTTALLSVAWWRFIAAVVVATSSSIVPAELRASTVSTLYGKSYQVNVNALGQNIAGDAANEPSLCIDPTNPNRMAIGWRQFDITNDPAAFRQAGVAFTTNGGLNWTFPGKLEAGTFRSDPVLASDANGVFYYMGISNSSTFACDLFRSTNGGANWDRVGGAEGGDKEWITIDRTTGPGHGNIYMTWSPGNNIYASDNIFTRSSDGGASWMTPPLTLPNSPYFGTLDVGPDGVLYMFGGRLGQAFFLNRSSDAQNATTPTIDLTTVVDLGGGLFYGDPNINPVGLLGQAWIAVDRSSGATRGNVYALCSVSNDPGNGCNVMFSRSIDKGQTWSTAIRINDDSPTQGAYHWFGTLAVAPNGRIDVCWNDTRHSVANNNNSSELYYSWSDDGGLTWAPNRPISPAFQQSLGYPTQSKMGDYIQIVSLNEGACIAYTATFNSEEDVYFVRAELPIVASVTLLANPAAARITWNAVPGISYCVQSIPTLSTPLSSATNVGCITATNTLGSVDDLGAGTGSRFYRVVRQP